MRKDIDWNIVKFQYEVYGVSPEDLAEQYGTTTEMINYAIKSEGWAILPVANTLNDWKLDPHPDQASIEQVREKLSLLTTIKKSALNPKYIALETAILTKALEILQTIKAEHPASATVLKNIAEMFQKLTDSASNPAGSQQDGKGSLVVNIIQKASTGCETSRTLETKGTLDFIEVKPASGKDTPRSEGS